MTTAAGPRIGVPRR